MRAELWRLTDRVLQALDRIGVHTPNRSGFPIIEIPLRDHRRIAEVGQMLFDRGVYVTLAAYPLVPKHEVGFRAPGHRREHRRRDRHRDRGDRGARRARRALRGGRAADGAGRMTRLRAVAGRAAAWQLLLAGGALLCALYVWVPPFKGSGPVMNVLGLLPVLAILAGVRRYRPAAKRSWLFFALGFALFWLGDLYTYSYPRVFGGEVPFPSIGDGMYILVYPALMIGLLSLVRRRNPHGDRPGLIDALIMTLGLALVSWVALIAPYIHDDTMDVFAKLVSIAYPAGDILLLAAAIRLAVDGGRRGPAFGFLSASIIALLVTDFVYGVVTLNGAYDGQVILDVGWISFYLLWGAAALHPSMRELSEPAPGTRRACRRSAWRS